MKSIRKEGPILSLSIQTEPDMQAIKLLYDSQPRDMSIEDFTRSLALSPESKWKIAIAGALGAEAPDETSRPAYAAVLSRITSIGVVHATPAGAADGKQIFRINQRGYHGMAEAKMIAMFSRLFLSTINPSALGFDKSYRPDPSRYTQFPTLIMPYGGNASPINIIIGRAFRYAGQNPVIAQFLREWHDDSDKWSDTRPNYQMNYCPFIQDIRYMFANNGWNGDIDTTSIGLGLPIDNKPPKACDYSDPMWQNVDPYGFLTSASCLWEARRCAVLWAKRSDILKGTTYEKSLIPALESVPLDKDNVKLIDTDPRNAVKSPQDAARGSVAIYQVGDPIEAPGYNIEPANQKQVNVIPPSPFEAPYGR